MQPYTSKIGMTSLLTFHKEWMEIQDSQREKKLQTQRRDETPTHIEADIEYISRRRKSTPKII